MTALAIIRSDRAVVIASDGACHDPNSGLLTACGSKVAFLPECSCIIGQRGAFGVGDVMRYRLAACRDFDDVLLQAPAQLEAVFDEHEELTQFTPHATLFIGGWSVERTRFETYRISTREKRTGDKAAGPEQVVAPYTLEPLPEGYSAPMPAQQQLDQLQINWDLESLQEDCFLALKLICAARISPPTDDDELGIYYSVGGFLQLTVLTRDRITSEIVHRWPDPLGEKIDPSRGELCPAFLMS